ncbi:MAG: A/G-specific adenine glycosylase [Anaerolineae bacterium]|nr:MAG: A/G-specific adenine glycosylase [Anaerolineae bacterium]
MNDTQSTQLAARLLAWYADHRRDLPWRRTRDPYQIWVAEVMLQQTQVATAIPYYERFLARLPTVGALAATSLDEVLKLWEGLGYYARARNLHAAARKVVTEFGGQVPDTMADLRSLPGVGRYTAGAILSIAYGQDVPALDGNARRVLSRLFAVEEDVTRGAGQRRLWALAEDLLPLDRAGDLNQALMDLGATLCTPRAPLCKECPLAESCHAHRLGQEERFPVRRPRRPLPHYEIAAGVIWNGQGQFLIAQRRLDGMLGGLWEFPGGKREPGETLKDCLRRELAEELDVEVAVGAPLTVVQHAYTHFRITMHAFHCRIVSGQPRALGCADWQWIALDDVPRFAFSAADHQIIAALHASANSQAGAGGA